MHALPVGVGLPLSVVFALQLALALAAARWVARRRAGVIAAAGCALVASALPFAVVTEAPILRSLSMMLGLGVLLRVVDLARTKAPLALLPRLWFMTAPFDTRTTTRAEPTLSPELFSAVAGYGLLGATALWLVVRLPPAEEATAVELAGRWLAGAAFLYATVDAVVALIRFGYCAAGVVVPVFHDRPILSRSVQEFWGVRWNKPVHAWLYQHCFWPLARRRRSLAGIALAFIASALIHFLLVVVAASVALALWMAAYFVAQGALVVIERALGVGRWRPALGRSWTALAVAGPSPMFIEPLLRALQL